jgi:hypothetical protein
MNGPWVRCPNETPCSIGHYVRSIFFAFFFLRSLDLALRFRFHLDLALRLSPLYAKGDPVLQVLRNGPRAVEFLAQKAPPLKSPGDQNKS